MCESFRSVRSVLYKCYANSEKGSKGFLVLAGIVYMYVKLVVACMPLHCVLGLETMSITLCNLFVVKIPSNASKFTMNARRHCGDNWNSVVIMN
jgi:hypothetical protein